jgi:hypothetical protein
MITDLTEDLRSRREFIKALGCGAVAWYLLPPRLLGETGDLSGDASTEFGSNSHYPSSRLPLTATPYVALPLGSIRPRGWLLKQLELQRDGLTGHAEEMPEWFPALQASAWTGGTGEDFEKGPYYLKGLVALAYGLDDDGLKKKAQVWIDAIIASQQADGSFGPTAHVDWWPRMVVTYVLRDYFEATNDPRVLPFLSKYYGFMAQNLPQRPLEKWGKARAADEIDTVLWLYNRTGDVALISVAQLLQGQVYDWPKAFRENKFFGGDKMLNHNVNTCQAVKAAAVWHLLAGQPTSAAAFSETNDHLMHEHGLVLGISSGTEELSGKSPSQAVETCSIVEQMLSDETNLRVLGDPQWGDHLERVAFNALPAALSDTIQQHVYYTRPNHPSATSTTSGFSEDSKDRFTPGPRSGFPCCCYNFHMGWPKYVQNGWAATHDNGLAVLAYGPSEVTAKVGSGTTVTITQETDYPFNDTIRLKVRMPAAVRFPLELRLPQWCASPQISVAGRAAQGLKPGSFYRIDREWINGDEIVLQFPMEVRTTTGLFQTVSIERGPLIYSLQIDAEKRILKADPAGTGFDQFELTPRTPWNYALAIDPENPSVSTGVVQTTMPDNPFVARTTPVQLTAKARRLPQWTFARNGTEADEPPDGPVTSNEPEETIRLLPFGTQFLRITQFPYLGTPPVPPDFFQEDFTGDDFGDRWNVYRPGWYREKGTLCCQTKRPSKIAAVGVQFANFVLETQAAVPAQGYAGVLFRATKLGFGPEELNGYYAALDVQKQIVLIGKSNGTWQEMKRAPFSLVADKMYPIRVVANGSRLSVYVQDFGSPVIEIDDGDHTTGTIGFRQDLAAYTKPRFGPVSVRAT